MFGLTRFDSDEELIRRALEGSERAWLKLVRRHEQRLYNYALRMSGNPDDAMDILQDVLVSVYRNLDSFRGDSQFSTWLFRIAAFRTTDWYRRQKWRDSQDEDAYTIADDTSLNSPEGSLSQAQDNQGVARLMSSLPLEQRQVVELKFFQHFTFDEIASQLGISSNTAKTRLYTALTKMRRKSALLETSRNVAG